MCVISYIIGVIFFSYCEGLEVLGLWKLIPTTDKPMITANSIIELPDELQWLILDQMDHETLQATRSINPKLQEIIDVYLERIAHRARKKFPTSFNDQGDAEIVERIYHLNNYIHGGFSGIIAHGESIGKKVDDKWNCIIKDNQKGPWSWEIKDLYCRGSCVGWYTAGQKHRLHGPAVVGVVVVECVPHAHAPTRECVRVSGSREIWYRDGQKHREGAPAETWWHQNGIKECEIWYRDGQKHREGAPAEIWWYSDDTKEYEGWYQDGHVHRPGGPAETEWAPAPPHHLEPGWH
jgi:hypothetical protein